MGAGEVGIFATGQAAPHTNPELEVLSLRIGLYFIQGHTYILRLLFVADSPRNLWT